MLIILLIAATFRLDDNSNELDLQVGIRFVGYSLAALSVLFAVGRGKLPLNLSIGVWALVPAFLAASALWAVEPLFAFVAGAAHLILLLFAWRLVNGAGQQSVVLVLVISGLLIGIASILVFYFNPELGASTPDILSGDPGGRMRGVTGQPNSLGSLAAFTLLLAVMHFRAFTSRQQLLAIAAIGVAAVCVFYSDSRTSTFALLLCLVLWRVCRANAAFNLFAVIGIALIACLVVAFVPDVTAHLSREGAGSNDLSSFNGRSQVWAVAWEHIQANPLLGQGYGSSRFILPKDDRLWPAALHAHDVYLELLFAGGAVALALYAAGVGTALFQSAKKARAEALVGLVFFLIVGVTEATPFAGLPLFQAFAFYTMISLCLARAQPVSHPNRAADWAPQRNVSARLRSR